MSPFVELISTIEAEIQFRYLGGAIRWCDEHFNHAWSNAIDRLDKALSRAIETDDHSLVEKESRIYKSKIVELLSEYKRVRDMDEATTFLDSIRSTSFALSAEAASREVKWNHG